MRYILVFLILNVSAYGKPQTMASFSLSTDLWLAALWQKGQTLYLSSKSKQYLGNLPHIVYHNRRVEDLVRFKPDLVLSDDMSPTFTRALLKRCGLPLHLIKSPQSLQDITTQRHALAKRLGVVSPPAPVLPRTLTPKRLLVLLPGRLTCGMGTLIDDLITTVGHKNAVHDMGKKGWGVLQTEELLRLKPDLILTSYQESPTQTRARATLAQSLQMARCAVLEIPEQWMLCPQVHIDALARLITEIS